MKIYLVQFDFNGDLWYIPYATKAKAIEETIEDIWREVQRMGYTPEELQEENMTKNDISNIIREELTWTDDVLYVKIEEMEVIE